MTAATRALAALVVAAAGACFNPQYDQPSCRMTGECPAGLRCDGEVCRSPAELIDAAETDAVDARPIDAVDASDGRVIDAVDAACVPDPLGERCNGIDDDCDMSTDEGFSTLGTACDGADTDLCLDDAMVCNTAGDGTVCGGASPDNDVEACNGADDDCDTLTDEAFPTLGTACDGTDGDACAEGSFLCRPDGTDVTCSDQTTTTAERCNGVNDDCDAATDEGFPLGQTCDGPDGDACAEGAVVCDPVTGGTRCSDMTSTTVELCNAIDEDCDVAIDEGFDLQNDITNCGMCGRVCANGFGSTGCGGGTCMPVCTAGAHDCDGNPVNGCEQRNTNSPCAGATDLGDVRGDTGADTINRTGFGEAFFRVTSTENMSGTVPILAQVTLTSPPGANFDLFVSCMACGGPTLSSTTAGVETINIGRTDVVGIDNSFDMLIEVRWVSSTACGNWSLAVTGNVVTTNRTCD